MVLLAAVATSLVTLLFCILSVNRIALVEAVNHARIDKLRKEELIELDRYTTDYYYETYEQIDARNSSYEDQLYRSMMALRHTLVINHYDYLYGDEQVMRQAMGAMTNPELCKIQLEALANMAANQSTLPITARNFFESYGRSEAGILDGNFVWLGSYQNCIRSSIPASAVHPYLPSSSAAIGPIRGRYCIAHMRAKKWPVWDKYFETMLRLRIGVCLPDSCHSLFYNQTTKMQEIVDKLTKTNLLAPFNSDSYEVDYLYCLPDEDSPLRQWNFGAKLFFAFVCGWFILLAYLNLVYYKRERTVRKLRESVDIKYIISERREGSSTSASNDSSPDVAETRPSNRNEGRKSPDDFDVENQDADKQVANESEVVRKISHPKQAQSNYCQGFDFIKAFSIQANLKYLLYGRDNEQRRRKDDETAVQSQVSVGSKRCSLPQSHQLSAANRRTSASNEALIKDLQHQVAQGEAKSKLAVISPAEAAEASKRSSKPRRVNMDIFDGIKAFFTLYIVLGHTLMFFFSICKDLRYADERMLDLTLIICINTLHVVSVFYIITGILLTYLVFTRQKATQLFKPQFWLLLIANRYLRLIPLYFMVFWFARHVSHLTGAGALWYDYRTHPEHVRAYCSEEPWSKVLTISAADIKIPRDCVPQTWYLSNDFRTLFILPFYIIILAKNRKAGYAAIFATFLVSWARLTNTLRNASIDYKVIVHWKPHVYSLMADRLHDVYTDLTIRLSTYLLGVVVGHLLYLYETRQIKHFPTWLTKYGMKLSVINAAIFFMGGPIIAHPWIQPIMPKQEDVDSDLLVLLIPLFKTFMEMSVSIILLLLATGGGYKIINRLLSSNISKIFANISYGVFLMHVEFMYKVHVPRSVSSYWTLYVYAVFIITVCNLLSLITHLTFEMPISNLVRYLFQRIVRAAS